MKLRAHVRAYTEKPGHDPLGSKWKQPKARPDPHHQLIFDGETTTDPAQALRFGAFQVRKNGKLLTAGVFCCPLTLSKQEVLLLKQYAEKYGLWFGDIKRFRKEVFLRVGYQAGASIIGLNLPFDLARIVRGSSEARYDMRGGFSHSISPDPLVPNVRTKHLSASAALIDFAYPDGQPDGRGMRNRGFKSDPHRGVFVDIRTLAAALLSRKHSLASLCEALGVATKKQETHEHGGPLTEQYIEYALTDVQATWECYDALNKKYQAFKLATPVQKILSEASLGKATLSEVGIKPLLFCQPDFPREQFGVAMAPYFGGRAEVRERKHVVEVIPTDFKSMYPTVNALMGLWRFMIADGYSQEDSTEETQAFLDRVSVNDLQKGDTWKHLCTLVQLKPDGDVLPLRAAYSKPFDKTKNNLTIGLNHVSSSESMWHTLADVIGTKVLTGKTPKIEKAITYKPGLVQRGLRPINLFGDPKYRIDPRKDDLFLTLINLRDGVPKSDPANLALKILANSTCYGILVEVQRDNAPKPESIVVIGPDGQAFETKSVALEEPGKYFHPLLASLITGAARLMLAITERLATDRGLSWAFCDTDSLALARPTGMDRDEFRVRAREIVDWFVELNPYEKPGSILKIEDANFDPKTKEMEPLYCYAISAKRYALFNLNETGDALIRKASAHGLGHLMAPYDGPLPQPEFGNIGVNLWQHDVWLQIIKAALAGHPNQVAYDYHPALEQPALQRYGATSPAQLRWVRLLNADTPYRLSVKPYGFMVAPIERTGPFAEQNTDRVVTQVRPGRPKKPGKHKPIAPFERDPSVIAETVIDRETGERIPVECLKTYREALALYHLSTEDKFENGGPYDVGITRRRRVQVSGVTLIGKEANKVGEAGEIDPVRGEVAIFKKRKNGGR
ncbi:MAG: hypothetical protein NXH78_01985 [Hyphomonadaceae bacterium]|nr:hypothetical protein [Hyphomonadaceae bacterium]